MALHETNTVREVQNFDVISEFKLIFPTYCDLKKKVWTGIAPRLKAYATMQLTDDQAFSTEVQHFAKN